jgi:hypothetical protein
MGEPSNAPRPQSENRTWRDVRQVILLVAAIVGIIASTAEVIQIVNGKQIIIVSTPGGATTTNGGGGSTPTMDGGITPTTAAPTPTNQSSCPPSCSPPPTQTPRPTPTYTPAPSPTPVPTATIKNMSVDAITAPPGVDTLISVAAGSRIQISATGRAQYGWEPSCGTTSYPYTDPDGNQYVDANSQTQACAPITNPYLVSGTEPIGTLLGRIGTSSGWFRVGSNYSATASSTGELYLIYNDSNDNTSYTNNSGAYSCIVVVQP